MGLLWVWIRTFGLTLGLTRDPPESQFQICPMSHVLSKDRIPLSILLFSYYHDHVLKHHVRMVIDINVIHDVS